MKPQIRTWERGTAFTRLALTGCLIVMLAIATALADPPDTPLNQFESFNSQNNDVRNYAPGELVVRLNVQDSTSISYINDKFGTEVLHYLYQLRSYLLTTDYSGNLEDLAAEIRQDTLVEVAHPNYLVDPLQPVQGSFPFSDEQNEGSYDDQPASDILHLPAAHTISMGAGVTVAVIDGGVDFNHPVFDGKAVSGWDYVDDDNNAYDEPGGDNSGHGTFVAGVVHLVAPEATIRAYRVTEIDGASHGYLVAEAIMQAVADGCDVINLSMALMAEHYIIRDAIAYARDHDVIVVAAAGNGHSDIPVYPASDPNALAVAALDDNSRLADLSRYGSYVDLCAPGIDIYSPYQNDGFAWWGGTSFASPFVAGQAALIISRAPGKPTWTEVRDLIESTALNLDATNPDYAGELGAGLIDPAAALGTFPVIDTAWVDPVEQSLHIQSGDSVMSGRAINIFSTNAPAKFLVSMLDQDSFITLLTDSGLTDGTIEFGYNSGDRPAGTYSDTVLITVEGVENSPLEAVVNLVVTPAEAQGTFVSPDTLRFTAPEGMTVAQVFDGQAFLFSENAPEHYFAYVETASDMFTYVQDSAGWTGDSVDVYVNPGGLSAGTYYNQVHYLVASAQDTIATLTIELTITPGQDSAWLALPSQLDFEIGEGNEIIYGLDVGIYSTNAPAAYTGSIPGGSQFTTLLNPTGETELPWSQNPAQFGLTVEAGTLTQGFYADTVVIDIDGIPGRLYFILTLTVTDPNVSDSAWVEHGPLEFTLPYGSSDSTIVTVSLLSSNAPAAYNVNFSDSDIVYFRWPHFVNPLKISGITNDTIPFVISAGDLDPGLHQDTIIFEVAGVRSFPYAVFTLNITGGPEPTDSAWLTYDNLSFAISVGSSEVLSGSVGVNSTNAPAAYTVSLPPDLSQSPTSSRFVTLLKTEGTTNDVVDFEVSVGTLGAGIYRDTLVFEVEGIPGTLLAVATLNVLSTGGGETAWVTPDTLVINVPEGTSDTVHACFFLGSSNAPAYFYTFVDDTMMIGTWFTQVTGFTGDSVCYAVPSDQVMSGTNCDPVLFFVEGVDEPVVQYVCTIKGNRWDSSTAHQTVVNQNYPNPFNPQTSISYSLGKASHVQLTVFNVLGQKVVTLVDEHQPAGLHEVTWDGTDAHGHGVAGGIYFYRIATDDFRTTRKMLYLK